MFFKNNTFKYIILIIICFAFNTAHSAELKSFFKGVRPLGMGNAFTAVADDKNVLFYNPAGLAKLQKFEFALIDPIIEVSKNTIDLIDDARDIDTDNTTEVTNLMRTYLGKHQHLRVSVTPGFGFRVDNIGFMITAFAQGVVDIEVHNAVYPTADLYYRQDLGVMGGTGMEFEFIHGLKLGLTFRALQRSIVDESYSAIEISDDNFTDNVKDDKETNEDYYMDFGMIYTLPFKRFFHTDIGVVYQNVDAPGHEEKIGIEKQLNVGIAMERYFKQSSLLVAFDYRDVSNKTSDDDDIWKRLHAGIEWSFPMFALRAGVSQGYLTFGTTMDFGILIIDAATYGEEIGSYSGQKVDRRYVIQLQIGW
ncbi:MAG: hypothetical protein GY714_00425 [Desulfobacterales bacterium]|nr:hypothetical protein [Desulfobacterales bacterium]